VPVSIYLDVTVGMSTMLGRMVRRSKRPEERFPLNDSDHTSRYDPEPVVPVYLANYREDLSKASVKAKMVVECSDLLREKYELDIRIWGMQDCEDDDIPERESLQRKSDAMFREIRKIVHHWKSPSSQNKWTVEEWEYIKDICSTIDHHSSRR